MNPHHYWMIPFVAFSTFLVILGSWSIHKIRKEEAKKRPIGFITSEPESRSRSSE
jgi:hypothetical protein